MTHRTATEGQRNWFQKCFPFLIEKATVWSSEGDRAPRGHPTDSSDSKSLTYCNVSSVVGIFCSRLVVHFHNPIIYFIAGKIYRVETIIKAHLLSDPGTFFDGFPIHLGETIDPQLRWIEPRVVQAWMHHKYHF